MDFALAEILLFFGAALGLSLWQLISVRREIREDQRRREQSRRATEGQTSGVPPPDPHAAPAPEQKTT